MVIVDRQTVMEVLARRGPRLDRSLEEGLRALVLDTGAWLPLVRFAEPQRPVRLQAPDGVDAWLMTWMPGQGSGHHDHGGAAGAFAVARGRVYESWVDPAGRPRTRRLGRGRIRSFGPDHVHDLVNDGPTGAVSLHVYRPTNDRLACDATEQDSVCLAAAGVDRPEACRR